MKQLLMIGLLLTGTMVFAQAGSKAAAPTTKVTQWQYLKLSLWESMEKGQPADDKLRKENFTLTLQQLAEAGITDEALLKQLNEKMKTTQMLNVLGRVGWELFNVSQETTPEMAVRYTYFLRKVQNP